VQASVFSFLDHAHPAATEFLDNAVVRDRLADPGRAKSYVGGTGKSTKRGGWDVGEMSAFGPNYTRTPE